MATIAQGLMHSGALYIKCAALGLIRAMATAANTGTLTFDLVTSGLSCVSELGPESGACGGHVACAFTPPASDAWYLMPSAIVSAA